jgi:hypothetical protein
MQCNTALTVLLSLIVQENHRYDFENRVVKYIFLLGYSLIIQLTQLQHFINN